MHLLRYRDSSAEYSVIIEVLEAHPVTSAVALVGNGYPAGVAVTWAMHHGGPFPATTDPLHTSVGAAAIRRWLRPISYQDVPEELLPVELRDGNATVPRRIDGDLVLPASLPGTEPAAP